MYFIVWMTPAQAEAQDRRVYNVPSDVRLGWIPYTIRVMWRGHTATFACHSDVELQRWLSRNSLQIDVARTSGGSDYYTRLAWTIAIDHSGRYS